LVDACGKFASPTTARQAGRSGNRNRIADGRGHGEIGEPRTTVGP
jgi:hypothetical protein